MVRQRESWSPVLRSYPESRKINSVSMPAENMYLRLVVSCDDDANFEGDPIYLLSKLFAVRHALGQVSVDDVRQWRDELVKVGLVVLYRSEPDEVEYLHVVDCKKCLRNDVKSEIYYPPYTESQPRPVHDGVTAGSRNESGPDAGRRRNESAPVPFEEPSCVSDPPRQVEASTAQLLSTQVVTAYGTDAARMRDEIGTTSARTRDGCVTLDQDLYPDPEKDPDQESSLKEQRKNKPHQHSFCTERKSSVPCSSTMEFNFSQRKFLNITNADIKGWSAAYPAVEITGELLRAGEWLLANPRRRKKNIRRFLSHWFQRCQERGGNRNYRPPPPTSPLRQATCRICGAKASKHIDGQGAFCPDHSPFDLAKLRQDDETTTVKRNAAPKSSTPPSLPGGGSGPKR